VLSDTKNIESLLRRAADHEISTTMPLGDVVRAILRFAGECRDSRADRGKRRTHG
jgi:hypothetical protein